MVAKIIRILKYSGLGLIGILILLGIIGASSSSKKEQPQQEFVVEENQEIELVEEEPKIIEEVEEIAIKENKTERGISKSESIPIVVPVTPKPVVQQQDPIVESETETVETIAPKPVKEESQQSSGSRYYTSSHYRAKYYYPEDCHEWGDLSKTYLKSFSSLDSLLSAYERTLSPEC